MKEGMETVDVSGVRWQVVYEWCPYEKGTFDSPPVEAEFYVTKILLNGDEWQDMMTEKAIQYFTGLAKSKWEAE